MSLNRQRKLHGSGLLCDWLLNFGWEVFPLGRFLPFWFPWTLLFDQDRPIPVEAQDILERLGGGFGSKLNCMALSVNVAVSPAQVGYYKAFLNSGEAIQVNVVVASAVLRASGQYYKVEMASQRGMVLGVEPKVRFMRPGVGPGFANGQG